MDAKSVGRYFSTQGNLLHVRSNHCQQALSKNIHHDILTLTARFYKPHAHRVIHRQNGGHELRAGVLAKVSFGTGCTKVDGHHWPGFGVWHTVFRCLGFSAPGP